MTSNQSANYVKSGARLLWAGKGYRSFLINALAGGCVSFLAMLGGFTLLLVVMINDYGVSRAMVEFHAMSGADAVTALGRLLFQNLWGMVLFSVVFGSLLGLKAVGARAAAG